MLCLLGLPPVTIRRKYLKLVTMYNIMVVICTFHQVILCITLHLIPLETVTLLDLLADSIICIVHLYPILLVYGIIYLSLLSYLHLFTVSVSFVYLEARVYFSIMLFHVACVIVIVSITLNYIIIKKNFKKLRRYVTGMRKECH